MAAFFEFIFVTWIIVIQSSAQFEDWKVGSKLLPEATYGMSVGHYGDTIFLLGGGIGGDNRDAKDLVTFDIETGEFTEYLDHFSEGASGGWGQGYTQIGNQLWIISAPGTYLNVFDTEKDEFYPNFQGITMSVSAHGGCLTQTVQNGITYLIVLAGFNSATLQILDLSTNSWLSNIPLMAYERGGVSCMAHNEKLYAIGGYFDNILYVYEHYVSNFCNYSKIINN